jgi:hypothetical protein
MQGCALHIDEPPELANCHTDDEAAWQSYGAIIFWLFRPGLSDEEAAAQCTSYWQRLTGPLLSAAADPLFHFYWSSHSYDQEGRPVIRRIILGFPDETRQILEWSIGNTETVELLRAFTDDQALGRAAVDAIKRLTDHRT